jgi:hypothetical protein
MTLDAMKLQQSGHSSLQPVKLTYELFISP